MLQCHNFNSKMKKATKMGKRIAAILDNKTGLIIMSNYHVIT